MAEIDPRLRGWLEKHNMAVAAWAAKGFQLTPEYARDGMAILTRTMVTDIPQLEVIVDETVEDDGPPVPVRVYHSEPDSALPVLIYLHGGGHMTGSIAVYDAICRKIALATRHVVVSVDYRLAPENPYPAGIADARTVIEGCADLLARLRLNFSGAGLALAGDSAGGAMSATLAHAMLDSATPRITQLILIYPGLDYTLSQLSTEALTGYLLEKDKILWYFDRYFRPGVDRRAASPLFMPVRPGFPRTLLITAGFCPLRDEAFSYVKKLRESGVVVEHLHLSDMIHAFLNLENLVPENCRRVYSAIAEFLNTEREASARDV